MKQPTEPPLTQKERAALTDLIIRAARTLPTDSDRKRLVRLHTLDRADRKQERHAAGNVSYQLGAVRAELAKVQAELDRLREGAEPYEDEHVVPTAGQFIWLWNAATPTDRLARAQHAIDDAITAQACSFDHRD